MNQVTIDKAQLVKQLKFDLGMVHNFEGHIKETMSNFLQKDMFDDAEATLQSLQRNRHYCALYRARIVAVLELIGALDKYKGDTSDIKTLESIITRLCDEVDNG